MLILVLFCFQDVRRGLNLGGHHDLPDLIMLKQGKHWFFKGKFVISTNAFKITWINVFGAYETTKYVNHVFIYYPQWEKGLSMEILETFYIEEDAALSWEKRAPVDRSNSSRDTFPAKATSIACWHFCTGLIFKAPCMHCLGWLLLYC